LNQGAFLITKGASLTLEDCIIDGTISQSNRFLFNVVNGGLVLKKNILHVTADNSITPNSLRPSLYYVITVGKGLINIIENTFTSNKPHTVGFLITSRLPTENILINRNHIYNFHGGILLDHSKNAFIQDNEFNNVSGGNIFIIEGDHILIKKNNIFFPGSNNVGDGIDISDSRSVTIYYNYILSGSCYSLVVLRGEDILIDSNKIIGGITYGIFVNSSIIPSQYNSLGIKFNKNITIINNYLSQNRYAMSGKNINGLVIKNNILIQRFSDSNSRKFWTNNDILFQNVTNVVWEDNFYKEAFSQDMNGINQESLSRRLLPWHGGIVF
jgi:hypothetical protein